MKDPLTSLAHSPAALWHAEWHLSFGQAKTMCTLRQIIIYIIVEQTFFIYHNTGKRKKQEKSEQLFVYVQRELFL